MSHPPKLRALIALSEGRLSTAGSGRLRRHLEQCPSCRRTQEAQGRYEQLRTLALEQPAPTLRWDTLEAALDRPPALPMQSRAPLWWAAVAAAAVVAFGVVQHEIKTTPLPEARALPARTVDGGAAQHARLAELSLLAGNVEIAEKDGVFRRAELHDALHLGMRVRTGVASEVHATLDDGSAIALDANSELALNQLDSAHIELALRLGSVRNRVSHLDTGESYEVRADGYTARVRGTHFTVAHDVSETRVAVDEGVVEVLSAGALVTALHAGESFSAHGSKSAPTAFVDPHAPELTHEQLGGVVLPRLHQVQSYVVYEHGYPGREGLALRAPLGTLVLGLVDQRGITHTLPVQVTSRLTQVSPQRLLAALNGRARSDRAAPLGPNAVRPVVRSGIVALRRCYERSLRHAPDLSARLLLRLQVTPEGRVGQALIVEQRQGHAKGLPSDLSSCVVNAVRSWKFPPPGGADSVELEVPIHLKSMELLLK